MDLFKLVTDWINERGSSTILRERLGLCHDEKAALARQLTELKAQQAAAQQEAAQAQVRYDALLAQHAQLQMENTALKTNVAQCEAEIQRLQEPEDDGRYFAQVI